MELILLILRAFLYLLIFSAIIGAIFEITALITQKSRKAGFLISIWSFFGGLLGSIIGFLPAYFLAYQAVIQSNPTLKNPDLNGLTQEIAAMPILILWFILLLLSSISDAMVGAFFGLKFSQSRSSSR